MSCDVGEATEGVGGGSAHSRTLPVASPRSQLILISQPFRRFIYVTAHYPTLLSLHLRHMHFTYVTWRAAHEPDPPPRTKF